MVYIARGRASDTGLSTATPERSAKEAALSTQRDSSADETGGRFGIGLEDAIILPLVVIAVAAKKFMRAALSFLIHLLDWAFPILLQLMRFPLFTLRLIGDGIAALTKAVVGLLPVSSGKKDTWRAAIARHWSWLRQKISYKAFEEALHHAFEGGMAWVFKRCRALTPGRALIVLAGAVLWLPVSFALATGMHMILFAKVAVWPAWTQLLHPVATVIAKSKLLVLPVYPAAWPQAKIHPLMQAMFQSGRYVASLYLVQKAGHRFRQTEQAAARAEQAMGRAAAHSGLRDLYSATVRTLNDVTDRVGLRVRAIATRVGAALAKTPLIGNVIATYAERYERANTQPLEPLSDKVSGFFARWSVKFTAEYYEAKEKAETAKRNGLPSQARQ